MGILTEKKKNGVTTAEKSTKKKKAEAPKDPLAEPIVVPEKIRKQAKDFGIDVGAIVDRANLVQSRVLNIEKAIMAIAKGLDERDQKIEPLINFAKRIDEKIEAMPQSSQQGTKGGGGINLETLLPKLLGGSEPNPMMEKFFNAIIESSIRRTVESESFDRVFREYMVKKMAKEIGEPLTLSETKTET